jgi:hypothetical protein
MERETLLSHLQDLVWSLPFFLYAETHYRFKYFFSFLKKAEPEVVADAPHRIEPGRGIPLLLLVKDADKFPATLTSVNVILRQAGKAIREDTIISIPITLNERLWSKVYELPCNGINGWLELDVQLVLALKGKARTYRADNHRTSSHAPLRVFVSDEPLPRENNLYFGDAHTHSERTDDQVEFGVPIEPALQLSRKMGLSFFCVADHSYDLDDSIDDFSRNDPNLPKWKSLLRDIQKTNITNTDFVVVQGEEISCRNSKDRNVHLLLLGDERFFEGSGDGAERWFQTRSEYALSEILSQKNQRALAFAAHPMEPVSILQRWLLGRGSWSSKDLSDDRIAGFQFANGMRSEGFLRGYKAWIRCLLEGRRAYCLAGNDAHGNFNRFRQIGIPFLRIRENNSQLFGKMRTGIFLEDHLSHSTILTSLAAGHFIISDGPVANIVQNGYDGILTSVGSRLVGSEFDFIISAKSTREFGEIDEVNVILGAIGEDMEQILSAERLSETFAYRKSVSVCVTKQSYVRVEVYSSGINRSDGQPHFCFTNPVWLTPDIHS